MRFFIDRVIQKEGLYLYRMHNIVENLCISIALVPDAGAGRD
jgi:hypothetical protein